MNNLSMHTYVRRNSIEGYKKIRLETLWNNFNHREIEYLNSSVLLHRAINEYNNDKSNQIKFIEIMDAEHKLKEVMYKVYKNIKSLQFEPPSVDNPWGDNLEKVTMLENDMKQLQYLFNKYIDIFYGETYTRDSLEDVINNVYDAKTNRHEALQSLLKFNHA